MATLAIDLPAQLDAALEERVKASGSSSKEEYLLHLIEDDCAIGKWDDVLIERVKGPFEPLPSNWEDLVRGGAADNEA